MLPPNAIDASQGSRPSDMESTRYLLSETICADELQHETTTRDVRVIAKCDEEFDETIRTVSEPGCSKRRIEPICGSTRSVDGRFRQSFSKSSTSLRSLIRRRSQRHGASSLPLEVELSCRQASYPANLTKDSKSTNQGKEEEKQTTTSTLTLIHATSTQQPSISKNSNNVQQVPLSDINTAAVRNNVTLTTNANRLANATLSLLRINNSATPGPSTSCWNNSTEQENDYVVDPVQGNAYYKGLFLGKVCTYIFLDYFCLFNY